MSNDAMSMGADFVIIGAMKAGTTSLYRYLAADPRIGMSRDKETDYFVAEKNYGKGEAWYLGQFGPGREIYGEASPNYTKADDFAGVPERIAAYNPSMKLIFIARDPVSRAVSQYRHSWTLNDITMSPDELPGTHEWQHIVATSRYARQLEAFREHFPDEQILVLDFKQLTGEPEAVMQRVYEFLGLRPAPFQTDGQHNDNAELSRIPAPLLRLAQSPFGRFTNRIVSRKMRDAIRGLLARGERRDPGPFPPEVLRRLEDELRDDAARFRAMTGMDFADWRV